MRGRGEGFSGTTIMDTWIKPRWGASQGRRRVWLGWGVNTDNYD